MKEGDQITEANAGELEAGDWLLVRSYGDALKTAQLIAVSGDCLRVHEDGQTAPNVWGLHRFTFLGRPDADGWIEWSGGENPVGGAVVDIRLRNRCTSTEVAADINWSHGFDNPEARAVDIIAYRPSPTAVATPSAAVGGEGAKRLTNYPDYIDDAEGLERIRASLLKVRDWHDMTGNIVNCNSLARLLDTIEIQRAQIAALQPSSAADAKPVEDEPFMWAYESVDDGRWRAFDRQLTRADGSICPGVALYRAQPQPSRQAGTEEQRKLREVIAGIEYQLASGGRVTLYENGARMVLAALKTMEAG